MGWFWLWIGGFPNVFRKKRRLEMAKPGERRKRPKDRNDEVSLSRRLLLVRGAMGAGFLALGGKLWQMQIAEGTTYEDVAEGNTLRFRSEEHTSELQSRENLVCRLLLEI